jgi:hypothetical protein
MRRPAMQPGFRFTLDKAEAGDPGYRFVWLIDPATAPKKADRVEVRAVFCGPNKTYTAVQGGTKRPTDATDRNWRQLIRQIGRQLVGNRLAG